jgi:hypothetical protein
VLTDPADDAGAKGDVTGLELQALLLAYVGRSGNLAEFVGEENLSPARPCLDLTRLFLNLVSTSLARASTSTCTAGILWRRGRWPPGCTAVTTSGGAAPRRI